MDNFQTPNKNTNILENLNREVRDAVNKQYNHSNSSPMNCLPNHTTPPSRFIKIKNPFKAAMNDHLHRHIFSPSVFAEVKTPKNSDKFKWTIEDVSSLQPAPIDTTTISQFEQSCSEDDVEVQAKIDKYFSQKLIAESPLTQPNNQIVYLPENASPPTENKPQQEKESCTVWTQTVLSLPPKLPEAVEKALLPYFTFTEDQRRQTVDLNSSLCRRLFHFESAAEETDEESFHDDLPALGSPIMGQQESDLRKRTFDSSPGGSIPSDFSPIAACSTPEKLNNCPISPITHNMDRILCRDAENTTLSSDLPNIGSFAKADFSGHMSVDNSFNLAPENEFSVGNQTNLSESPVRSTECIMESSCNWDLEYNNISISTRPPRRMLFDHRPNVEKMDISNLTTPKSKIINSQRKKLSDSFKLSEATSDDELNFEYEENQPKFRKFFHENVSKNEENSQDTGYSTELSQKSGLPEEGDMMMTEDAKNVNIYASTPSKRYFSDFDKEFD